MKWIKASERQPEDWEFVFCRTTAKTIKFIDTPIRFIASEAINGTVYGVHPYLNLDKGLDMSVVEWLDESTDWVEDMYLTVYNMHPYKKKGDPDSYSSFNEGWADACGVFESELEKYFEKSNK